MSAPVVWYFGASRPLLSDSYTWVGGSRFTPTVLCVVPPSGVKLTDSGVDFAPPVLHLFVQTLEKVGS